MLSPAKSSKRSRLRKKLIRRERNERPGQTAATSICRRKPRGASERHEQTKGIDNTNKQMTHTTSQYRTSTTTRHRKLYMLHRSTIMMKIYETIRCRFQWKAHIYS